jgi:hypothetical protein
VIAWISVKCRVSHHKGWKAIFPKGAVIAETHTQALGRRVKSNDLKGGIPHKAALYVLCETPGGKIANKND